MLLTPENIAHYLLEKGLIGLEQIVKGQFSVRDQSSRNANFAVNREYAPAYLIKQVRAHDQEKRETLRIEATCYWLANNDENYRPLREFLPRYYEYDYLNHILLLELLPDVENLFEFFGKTALLETGIATKLAELMASYHTYSDDQLAEQPSFKLFRKQKPWVFTLSDKSLSEMLKTPGIKNAEKQMLQLILSDKEFVRQFQAIQEEWSVKSLIHGDIKFPNFLINRDFMPGAAPQIRLIDWELADIGDPLWDVAAILQNYLSLWVFSGSGMMFHAGAPVQLEQIRPSIAAFWQRYLALNNWPEAQTRSNTQKLLRYTAMKLVHTCFESVQSVADMPLHSAKLLQLSLNLLRQPEEALRNLLGIQTPVYHENAVLSY